MDTDNRAYVPHPIRTDDVELSPEILELAEVLAKNVHEVWAQTRLDQGWTWGAERNDLQKQHPSIIPYEELSEEEKVLDRNTAITTLKLIQKLGYTITKE